MLALRSDGSIEARPMSHLEMSSARTFRCRHLSRLVFWIAHATGESPEVVRMAIPPQPALQETTESQSIDWLSMPLRTSMPCSVTLRLG